MKIQSGYYGIIKSIYGKIALYLIHCVNARFLSANYSLLRNRSSKIVVCMPLKLYVMYSQSLALVVLVPKKSTALWRQCNKKNDDNELIVVLTKN